MRALSTTFHTACHGVTTLRGICHCGTSVVGVLGCDAMCSAGGGGTSAEKSGLNTGGTYDVSAAHACVYVDVRMDACGCVRACICIFSCVCVCVGVYVRVCVCGCVHAPDPGRTPSRRAPARSGTALSTDPPVRVCESVCMSVCMCVSTCVYVTSDFQPFMPARTASVPSSTKEKYSFSMPISYRKRPPYGCVCVCVCVCVCMQQRVGPNYVLDEVLRVMLALLRGLRWRRLHHYTVT